MWKTIKQYPNYEINILGQVRNKNTLQILKPRDNGRGYLKLRLTNNYGIKENYIHRLMGFTFLNLTSDLTIDHIDWNPSNNNLDNLQVLSLKENMERRRYNVN